MKKKEEDRRPDYETVLILQGGGSLGAYECGVYKAMARHGIKFDIVAGTSIGAINAAIIAGTQNDDAVRDLEGFWLTLAETTTPSSLPDSARAFFSSMQAAMYGNPRAFAPKWLSFSPDYFLPFSWPYLYDITPLKNTLEGCVDFGKLKERGGPRLIVTSTDIQKGSPVVFDSHRMDIDADHVLASAGYPFYGISWTQIDGKYLWDGSLLSNTPLREVIDASPKCDKLVYLVNLFPRHHEEMPRNMWETWHRARDIIHTDKTDHNVRMSRIITRYLALLKEMHGVLKDAELDERSREKLKKLEVEYHKLAEARGAIIRKVIRIERSEESSFLFEDADFSMVTIKQLIEQGENDAEMILAGGKEKGSGGGGGGGGA